MKERKKVTDFFRRKTDDHLTQTGQEDRFPDAEVRLSDEKEKKFIIGTLIGITAAGGVLLLAAGMRGSFRHDEVTLNPSSESEQMMMTLPSPETETGHPTAETETEFFIPAAEAEKLRAEGEDTVREKIFGSSSPHKVGLTLTLSGITDAEKAQSGMETADFLHDAGIFLRDNGITASRIIAESRTETSIPGSFGYEARLQGDEKHLLEFVVLPDFPGEYLFTLTTLPDVPEPETQSVTNVSPSSTAQPAADDSSARTGRTAQPAESSDYYATDLSVESVPQKLLNYLDSPYTFQFRLYDYLYSKGLRGKMTASVSDFSVDGTRKEATIHLTLSDGGSVTAVYSKDSNAYSFS